MKEISESYSSELSEGLIREALQPFGVFPTDSQIEAIRAYTDLLLLWNQKISLTSIRRPRLILERHFGESLFALSAVPLERGRLADVGSGAGFPGLALKVFLPDLNITLIEANHKKATFLIEVTRRLRFTSVQVRPSRVEDLQTPPASFNIVTARAIGNYAQLLSWARPALAPGGSILLWVALEAAKQLARTKGWGWREPLLIPGSVRRALLIGTRSSEP